MKRWRSSVSRGHRICSSLLPDEFTKEQYRQMRQQQGKDGDGESTLRSWQSRGHIVYDEVSGRLCKTEEYKRKYRKV